MATASPFLDALLSGQPASHAGAAAGAGLDWFDALRGRALERANALSVPTPRDEEWRFTDLAPLARLSFQPVRELPAVDEAALQARFVPEACARLVFIDGVLAPAWSKMPAAGEGVSILDPKTALSGRRADIEPHLGRIAAFDTNLFAALNTAFMQHAAVIVIDPERALPCPVHVLHVATSRERAQAIYPRTLVVAGAHSRGSFIEDFTALGDAAYFTAPVAEFALGAHAEVSHIRLQREAARAFHLGTCAVAQAAGSSYRAIQVALGARLSRLDLDVMHAGSGCSSHIDGLAMIADRQLADTHSCIDHAHPDGHMRQVHKCVAGGGAHAVFNGKVLVREGAQRTDAGQSLRGLLLSERARIDAKPQLEIFADDVKCAHGAAIGQLDAEQLFYLRSRGFTAERARNLLTYAFAAAVIERIAVPSLKSALTRIVLERTQEVA